MWEHRTFTAGCLDVTKLTTLTPLLLLISYKFSFPIVWFGNVFPTYFGTEIS
jgi:hypothetical protein